MAAVNEDCVLPSRLRTVVNVFLISMLVPSFWNMLRLAVLMRSPRVQRSGSRFAGMLCSSKLSGLWSWDPWPSQDRFRSGQEEDLAIAILATCSFLLPEKMPVAIFVYWFVA